MSTPSLIGVSGIESTTPEFRAALVRTAASLGIDPDYLATVISFESQFQPSIENKACIAVGKTGCAIGLIQFTGPARDELGVLASELRNMSAVAQLDYVRRYYARKGFAPGRAHTLEDAYFAVLWPAAIGKPLSTVLMRRDASTENGKKEYALNQGLDFGRKGYITANDVARAIRTHYDAGMRRPRVSVDGGAASGGGRGGGGGSAVLLALGAGAAWFYFKKRKSS